MEDKFYHRLIFCFHHRYKDNQCRHRKEAHPCLSVRPDARVMNVEQKVDYVENKVDQLSEDIENLTMMMKDRRGKGEKQENPFA